MSKWPGNYGVNLPPWSVRTGAGGCPYGTAPPDYDFYQPSVTRLLYRRFNETQLTFAAKQFYLDGETIIMNATRIGESCYGHFVESAGVRSQLLTFEVDVNGTGVTPGNIAVNIFAAVTDVDVRDAFYLAAYALGNPILFFAAGTGAVLRIIGKRTHYAPDWFGGTAFGANQTTQTIIRGSACLSPPLANLGGRGAIMAPMNRIMTGSPGQMFREGSLLYGNHKIT